MKVYLDNAATTRPHPEVIRAISDYMESHYGNPSSQYGLANEAKEAVDAARECIAGTINASPNEIYFTSGGSEGDNWAIKGIAEAYGSHGKNHIITSSIEHKAVLNSCKFLESHEGFAVTYIQPDDRGFIKISDIEKAIREDTVLVSIMLANNEIGTIEPIRYISDVCKDHGVLCHTDAVQAYCHMNIDVQDLGVDLLTTSGHKFHGPNGTGFLYVRNGVNIAPLIHGGQQENGLRAGTENVPGIVGLAKAAEIMHKDLAVNVRYMQNLRNYFIDELLKIPGVSLNGSYINRLCNNINISINGIAGEQALAILDLMGIYASSGSACNSHDNTPSHVLTSIGLNEQLANSSLRFTISENNTQDEIDYTLKTLKQIIHDLK